VATKRLLLSLYEMREEDDGLYRSRLIPGRPWAFAEAEAEKMQNGLLAELASIAVLHRAQGPHIGSDSQLRIWLEEQPPDPE
jgi:hypothetical protein